MCLLCDVDATHAHGTGHAVMEELFGSKTGAAHNHGGLADRDANGNVVGDVLGIPSNPGTNATISIGQTVTEVLETVGDRDWFRVTLDAGETYEITLNGVNVAGTGLGALPDPFLRVYSASGSYVTGNDDGGPGLNSELILTSNVSGTFYLEAAAWDDRYTGGYQLSISTTAPPAAPKTGSLQELADYLVSGFHSIPRHFNLGTSGINAKGGTITYTVSGFAEDSNGLSADRADLVREAFKLYEEILGINFQETTATNADLRFRDNDNGAYAGTFYDRNGNQAYIDYAVINIAATWHGGRSNYDSYTYQTILHEIGHALGLGHQGPYNGNGGYPNDAQFLNDSWQASMMSYFSQNENPSVGASFAYLLGPMAADLIALDDMYAQYGYGVANAFTGNTVYGFGTNISAATSEPWHNLAQYADHTSFTIIDGGGIDTLNVSGYSADQRIDLRVTDTAMTQAFTSDIGFETANMTIAAGTVIEHAYGGTGDDQITGNYVANILAGNTGNDRVFGGEGADRIFGNAGSDSLFGGDGDDKLEGNAGADLLDGGAGAFDIAEYFYATAGVTVNLANNAVNAGIDAAGDILQGIEGLAGGMYGDTLIGDAKANLIYGRLGDDTLDGGGAKDWLDGSSGDDRLIFRDNDAGIGGDGADIYEFHSGTYQVVGAFEASQGDKLDISNLGFATKQAFLDTAVQIVGLHTRFEVGGVHNIQLNFTDITEIGLDQIVLV